MSKLYQENEITVYHVDALYTINGETFVMLVYTTLGTVDI